MKKFFLFLVLISFSGCSFVPNVNDKFAEVHYCFFTGENEQCSLSIWSGRREGNYCMNGIPTPNVDFSLLVFSPKVQPFPTTCSVDINGVSTKVTLENSPYDDTLACDLGRLVSAEDKIVVYFSIDNISSMIELSCVSSSYAIDYKKALSIGLEKAKQFLNSVENYEIYLKIITSPKFAGVQFWFFKILSSESEFTCVIDVNSGEILATK